MKKVVSVFSAMMFFSAMHAQLMKVRQEDPKDIKTVVVWFIPTTDDFPMIDSIRPVLAHTANFTPVYILSDPKLYQEIQDGFYDSTTNAEAKGRVFGFEFQVDYVRNFSLYSKEQVRNAHLSSQQQFAISGFRTKSKYTVVAKTPAVVYGVKKKDVYGNIVITQILDNPATTTTATTTTVVPRTNPEPDQTQKTETIDVTKNEKKRPFLPAQSKPHYDQTLMPKNH